MTVSRDFVNHRKWSSYEESVEMFSRISNFDAIDVLVRNFKTV